MKLKYGYRYLASAASLLLVLALGASCAAPIAPTQSPAGEITPPETAVPETLPPAEPAAEAAETPALEAGIELTEAQLQLLAQQCLYLPDFEAGVELDESFYRDYIFGSYTGSGAYPTKQGEGDYEGYLWSVVPEKEVRAMVLRMLGREMPECRFAFDQENPYLYYEDGFYYVNCSDFGDILYEAADTEVSGAVTKVYFNGMSGGESLFRVCMELSASDQENGFVIQAKTRL